MSMCFGIRRPGRLAGAGVLAAAAVGTALVAAPSAGAATVHVVAPGQSIQRAVDASRPGDIVQILPGTYQENVLVTVPRLTIRGSGQRNVTLEPAPKVTAQGAPKTGAAPTATTDATAATSCFTAGTGICVAGTEGHRLKGVHITGLTVTGFATYGIAATQTDGLKVTGVSSHDNGMYGIGEQKSVRALFAGNRAANNGEAGIFLANTTQEEGGALDQRGARVFGNELTGNKMGVVLRRVRDMNVEDNTMSGNCAGMFVIGDENTPRGGDLTVRQNVVSANTKYCAATSRLPFVQGAGIVLTGVENTVVERNTVTGNSGTSVMSGGVVLFHSLVNVPNTGNTIRDNTLSGNAPADLADRDTAGKGNTFTGNSCSTSQPAGHC
ncbi:nitrous oxide reductase family maturation protein NosD [Streptomyces sp. NPDC020917]|uniref:nitrous oxide reductase family maturation protein NosD n=1 Tax=Streptomyces sp. NPDC020917 TaxID=3365102 RepID=UPI0037882416